MTFVAYLLIAVGLLMLLGELLIPSGVCFVLAVGAIVGGVVIVFLNEDPYTSWLTLIAVFLVVPVVAAILLHYWPKTPLGRRFFLAGPEEDATVASMPVNVELEQLRGRLGRTLSDLRPAGVTDFDGRRVDTISEGMLIEAGRWVRCIDVRAGKVIVRAVNPPDLGELETADLT